MSVVNAIAGNARLFFLNLHVSSVAKCWASEALPPLPKKIILRLLFIALMLFLHRISKFISNGI